MIITCNCGEKKFTLPDNSIPVSGRMVQCGYCGLKWKQFPIETTEKKEIILSPAAKQIKTKPISPRNTISQKKPIKPKKKAAKKTREINLYSPEYLAKKHGIKIKDSEPKVSKGTVVKDKVSFGFYSSLLVFLVFVIFFSRALFFAQSYIITLFPITEYYLSYFFENIRNIFEIWRNLITSY